MGPGHRHSQAYVKVQLGLRVGSLPSVALCVTFISGMASPECLLLSFWSTVMHTEAEIQYVSLSVITSDLILLFSTE